MPRPPIADAVRRTRVAAQLLSGSPVRSAEQLSAERAGLADLEAQQEAAREQRVRWQVEAAQVEARHTAATERANRAQRLKDGVPIDEETWREIALAARGFNVLVEPPA